MLIYNMVVAGDSISLTENFVLLVTFMQNFGTHNLVLLMLEVTFRATVSFTVCVVFI